MNVPLTRRSVDCVSDLTIDRWLLGETPGSDEARRLEQHMQRCAVCAARLGSLRNLYANQPDVVATSTARALEAPPRPTPAETGVLQVIVMRDGLLVGTEYFTPGRWVVGSAPGSDLTLVDGPLGRHAALTFHAGTVAIEAREGVVFVNGVRLQRAEVRPIDEVWVGPYALRVRVITERWSWPAMVTQPLPAQEPATLATVVERATPQDTRLEVSVWWGDTRVSTCCATDRLTASDVSTLGFERTVQATRGALGRWDVTTPTGALTLALHEATAIEHGPLKLLLKVTAPPAALGRARSRERLFPAVLLSTLVAAAALLAAMPAPTDDEDFRPRPVPPVSIHVMPPAPKLPKPQPSSAPDPTSPPAVATRPSSRQQRASPPPPKDRFEALDRVMRSASSATAALTKLGTGAPRARRGPTGPALAMPGIGAPLVALGVGAHDGIGRAGARAGGELRGGGYGREGKIGGLVVGPVRPAGLSLPKTNGPTVDRDAVAKVIAEHLQEVQRCYEAALLLEGSSGGRLLVEWTIAPSGAVTQAKVASTSLKQASVPQCVLSALRRWAFPKAKGGNVVVSYPFVFQASTFR